MSRESAVFESLAMIESNIRDRLSVENIAGYVFLSKYHYQHIFREILGESVMEYVTKRKLTLAGNELTSGRESILNIALSFGYNSHEGFTRAFKAYMGVTPSEYRRYGLTAISKNILKERCKMTYSDNTNQIIRELNAFVVTARETAELARKSQNKVYLPFWTAIATRVDEIADRVKLAIDGVTSISKSPDAIISRFEIVKAIEDAAFEANLIELNVTLMVQRGKPEHVESQQSLCNSFACLADISEVKVHIITGLLNELSALIFDDMRANAKRRLTEFIVSGKKAIECIQGYDYIRQEFEIILDDLSKLPCEQVSVNMLDDLALRISILSLSIDMDAFRSPADREMFAPAQALKNELADVIDFFASLPTFSSQVESTSNIERSAEKHFNDIIFQGNILLFYTRGEVSNEKLGSVMSAEQKSVFEDICGKVNDFIAFAISANKAEDYKTIVDMLTVIHTNMIQEADTLAHKGGAIRVLAQEYQRLANAISTIQS